MEIIIFLLIFFIGFTITVIYSIKSVKNYEKYTFKGSKSKGFNSKLVYNTKYSLEDCLNLLSRKNIYDVFNYTFKYTNEKEIVEIIFTGCNTHLCRSIRTVYLMRFIRNDNDTTVEMMFQNELYISPIPCIPEYWVDEFMLQKLDACRVG